MKDTPPWCWPVWCTAESVEADIRRKREMAKLGSESVGDRVKKRISDSMAPPKSGAFSPHGPKSEASPEDGRPGSRGTGTRISKKPRFRP